MEPGTNGDTPYQPNPPQGGSTPPEPALPGSTPPQPTPAPPAPGSEQHPQNQPSAGAVIGPQNPVNPSIQPPQSPAPAPIPQSPVNPNPPQPGTYGYGSVPGPQQPPAPVFAPIGAAPKNKKPLLIGAIIAAVLLIGTAGFVFGLYLPNRPQNVWRTGLDRSGDVLHKLVTETTKEDQLERLEKSKLTGSIDISGDGFDLKGSIDSRIDATKSNTQVNLRLDGDDPYGGAGTTFDASLHVLSEVAQGNRFPDIFIKFSGYRELGLFDLYAPELNSYDGRWIAVSSDYLDAQLGHLTDEFRTPSDQANIDELTAEDIAALASAFSRTASDYLFTSDESKGIIWQREYVGKETLDDISAHRYKAGYNVDNIIPACKALIENIFAAQGIEKFFNKDQAAQDRARDNALKTCDDAVPDDKRAELEAYTFDLWIDTKYKLIHKARFTEENQDGYVDIGQRYTGGDVATFFLKAEIDDVTADIELVSNFKTLVTSLDSKMAVTGTNAMSMAVKLTVEPYTEQINVTRPDGAVDIEQILGQLNTFDMNDTQLYGSEFEFNSSDFDSTNPPFETDF